MTTTPAPVVLITGALAGIGRASALAFAREGARLVVSGRNEATGEALAEQLRALGAEAEFVRADVRDDDDVRRLVDKTVERFGRLDAVAPGPIDTGMLDRFTGGAEGKTWMAGQVPVKRLGQVDEIAAAIVFVAIGKATFMTGQSLSVDGGHTAG